MDSEESEDDDNDDTDEEIDVGGERNFDINDINRPSTPVVSFLINLLHHDVTDLMLWANESAVMTHGD